MSNSTSADPDPFEADDTITIHVDGDWDTVTSDWLCDEDWLDGGCGVVSHAVYVWGSDGFSDEEYYDDYFDSTGGDSWDFNDTDGAAYMESIEYDTEIDVSYCDEWYYTCWDVDSDSSAEVDPEAPTITSDNGSDVWWFNGETPDGYAMSITLHSSAGDDTVWSVDGDSEGGPAILLNGGSDEVTGSSVTVSANSTGSFSSGDQYVYASIGSAYNYFQVTARLAAHAVENVTTDPSCPLSSWGFRSNVRYYLADQTWTLMSVAVPLHEEWGSHGWDYSGSITGWDSGSPNPATNSEINDQIELWGSGSDPNGPTTACRDSTQIDHWDPQTWWVGSTSQGAGVEIVSDTLERYRGCGRHIISGSAWGGPCS